MGFNTMSDNILEFQTSSETNRRLQSRPLFYCRGKLLCNFASTLTQLLWQKDISGFVFKDSYKTPGTKTGKWHRQSSEKKQSILPIYAPKLEKNWWSIYSLKVICNLDFSQPSWNYLWFVKMFLSRQNNHSRNSLCIGQDGKMLHTECLLPHRTQYFTSFVSFDYFQLQVICAYRANTVNPQNKLWGL